MVQKLVPLCSSQYERQFNTVRTPGKESGLTEQKYRLNKQYAFSFRQNYSLFR
jgi:hypothetical protein